MEMDIKEFICRLEEWKRFENKKDIDFCREVGIHPNTLVNWKKGKSLPQAKHMKKICEVLGIKEVDLSPLSFYTAMDNANKLYYRAQQLQRYANAKGLDEDFYRRIINEPYFMKEFPFSSISSRFTRLGCPSMYGEDADYLSELQSIPMVKYEFADDYGKIIMLTEDDIDFLVKLQRTMERTIRDEFCLEKHRKYEQHIKELIAYIASEHLEDGKEMDVDKLYRALTEKTDVNVRFLTAAVIWDRFGEYCKTHKVSSKPFRQYMTENVEKKHPPMTDEEIEAWREHYKAAHMTDEEIEDMLQNREKTRQFIIEYWKEVYRQNDKEDGNNG